MRCERIEADLYRMADGELRPPDAAAVQAHLEGCRRCEELYEHLVQESQSLAGALAVIELEDAEVRRLEKRLLQEIVPPRRAVFVERATSLAQRFYLVGIVLLSYVLVWSLPVDAAAVHEQIAGALLDADDVSALALNLAAGLLTVLLVISGRSGLAYRRISKGGVESCS